MHDIEQLIEDLGHVRMIGHFLEFEGSSLLSLVLLKVRLVNGILNLKFPLLFDLVVIDDQIFSLKALSVQIEFCVGCIVWLFEANECKITLQTFIEFNALYLTMLSEDILNVIFGPLVWEIFDEKIASLL